jgi:hypothetical protein
MTFDPLGQSFGRSGRCSIAPHTNGQQLRDPSQLVLSSRGEPVAVS